MPDILSGLNKQQIEAVLATDGPVLIFAGAGSGKTRVLTRKIAYLLHQKKTTPHCVLAVTFTNKAANEMKERIDQLLGPGNYVNIGTFHSICARILRGEKNIPGFPADFTIYDTNDCKKVMHQVYKATNTDPKEIQPSLALHYIGMQKQMLLLPGQSDEKAYGKYLQEKLAYIYKTFEHQMRENDAYDFDDLLMRPILMFREHSGIAEKYRNRWDYVLVDEYQDTNPAQFELLTYFTGRSKNICVVGDDDQSIYGWRGADIRNILEFEKTFPGAKVIKLEQNYRSTKNIIGAASAMIRQNARRADKNLWTDQIAGEKILYKECIKDYDEASYIANSILHSGSKPGDFALLYRTNAQSRLLEEALRNRGVRYVLVGGVKFYERKEIKDILAYLYVLINPNDTVNLKRIINVPVRGIGDVSLKKMDAFAIETRRTLWEAFQYPEEAGLHTSAVRELKNFMELMNDLQSKSKKLGPAEFCRYLLEKSGLYQQYKEKKDPESEDRTQNQEEFINSVQMFESYNPGAEIKDFVQDVSLQTDIDQWEDTADAVTLMTIHSAKGLEFRQVFIAGAEEGLFPIERARLEQKEMEEERRLFYVALTRAMERVYITSCRQRMRYGLVQGASTSSFIDEIPDEYLIRESAPFPGLQQRSTKRAYLGEHISVRNDMEEEKLIIPLKAPKPGSVKVGDRVNHKLFGKGRVRSIARSSLSILLRIDFDNGVNKTIAEKFVEKI
ncbi:MAG: UvrD-helicase domain-containing protein [FCB group bacterium]|nr:UvrD-helicase domain-containing protein [FCB group bacterium]